MAEATKHGLPLTQAEFHILLSLAAEPRHGYGIMQDVAAATNREVELGPGTLYGAIKRLLERGWIVEADERPDPALDDQRRRYYRLTDRGRGAAEAEAARLARLLQIAQQRKLGPAGAA
jgi:DNA-binding PadR family transcriptional regulator